MELRGILFGKIISPALRCINMKKDRMIVRLRHFQCINQRVQIVAVNRAVIAETQIFKEGIFIYALSDFGINRGKCSYNIRADFRNFGKRTRCPVFKCIILRRGSYRSKVFRHCSDIRTDGHIVVVKNDNQVIALVIVERLVCKTACQRTIADNGNYLVLFTFEHLCLGKTDGGRNRGGRMA